MRTGRAPHVASPGTSDQAYAEGMSKPSEEIPPGLRPPVEVALAKAVKVLPAADALRGKLCFEPKWDGYIHWIPSSPEVMPIGGEA